jgi:hypothetical protein
MKPAAEWNGRDTRRISILTHRNQSPSQAGLNNPNTNDREIEEEENDYDVSILTSGMTQEGGKLLQQILGSKIFAYPKPLSLVRSLIRATTRRNDIVLDSFAGTGTTGHAVLDLNREDGGRRRFVCVEMDAEICRTITAVRLRRVIEGYSYQKSKGGEATVPGLGGAFSYCALGIPLFDDRGNIREGVTFNSLAAYVYLSETGTPIPRRATTPLLGVHNGTAVYLLFNGILGDRRPAGGNVLTHAVAQELPPHPDGDGGRIVYGEACRLAAPSLKQYGITFKQIPFNLRLH